MGVGHDVPGRVYGLDCVLNIGGAGNDGSGHDPVEDQTANRGPVDYFTFAIPHEVISLPDVRPRKNIRLANCLFHWDNVSDQKH